jgi:hypothetical protein
VEGDLGAAQCVHRGDRLIGCDIELVGRQPKNLGLLAGAGGGHPDQSRQQGKADKSDQSR